MTLKAVADKLNTTTMTIYRRLKKAGINIDELRDADTGELTPHGAGVIASLFKNTDETQVEQAIEQVITGVITDDATGATGAASGPAPGGEAAQVAALTATVEGLRALVAQLESERDELRRQVATITAALQAEQADRQQERLLLTGAAAHGEGGPDQRARGWFARLFHRGD